MPLLPVRTRVVRRTLTPVLAIVAVSVCSAAFSNADAAAARPTSVEIRTHDLSVVTDSTGARARIGIRFASRVDRMLWLSARIRPPGPGSICELPPWPLEPRRALDFACLQDTVLADQDYVVELLAFANAEGTDTVETATSTIDFDEVAVGAVMKSLAVRRQALEARRLPKVYENVRLGKHPLSGRGTLTVRFDGFEFVAPKHTVHVTSAQIRAVHTEGTGTGQFVVVDVDDGGHLRHLAFGPGRTMTSMLRETFGLGDESRQTMDHLAASLEAAMPPELHRPDGTPHQKPSILQALFQEPAPPVEHSDETYVVADRPHVFAGLGLGLAAAWNPAGGDLGLGGHVALGYAFGPRFALGLEGRFATSGGGEGNALLLSTWGPSVVLRDGGMMVRAVVGPARAEEDFSNVDGTFSTEIADGVGYSLSLAYEPRFGRWSLVPGLDYTYFDVEGDNGQSLTLSLTVFWHSIGR